MTDPNPNRSRDGKYAEKIQSEAAVTLGEHEAPRQGPSTTGGVLLDVAQEIDAARPADHFAHLSGMEKATAQSEYAQTLNSEAAAAYVDDLSSKILAVNPDAARLYVNRSTDVESGLTFSLDRVEDKYGSFVDVDLIALEQHAFQDVHLDAHVDHDDSSNELYINLDPGH